MNFFLKSIIRVIMSPVISISNRYPLLHKINKVYVNLRTREVTVEVDTKQINILSKHMCHSGKSEKYLINREDFEQVLKIIREKKS